MVAGNSKHRQRRTEIGSCASAALPALWKALARLGWTHADFARAMHISTASATAILYGDSRAGRRTSTLASQAPLNVRPLLWEKPCPADWKPLHPSRVRARRERRDELAATG